MLITQVQKQYPANGKKKFIYKSNQFTPKDLKLDLLKIIKNERSNIDLKNQLNKKLLLSGQSSLNFRPQDQTLEKCILVPQETQFKIEEHIFNQKNITHRQSSSSIQHEIFKNKQNSNSFKSFTTSADIYFQQLSQRENSDNKKVKDSVLLIQQNETANNIPSLENINFLDQIQDQTTNRTRFIKEKKKNSLLRLILSDDRNKDISQTTLKQKKNTININSLKKFHMNDTNFAVHLSNLNVLQSIKTIQISQNSKLPILMKTQTSKQLQEQKSKQNKLSHLCQIIYELIVHTKAISFNDLVTNYILNNPSFHGFDVQNPDFQIGEFVSVLKIATEAFKSEKLLNQILIFAMNIDESLFRLMFKKIKQIDDDNFNFYEIINDPNISNKYKLRKNLTREEIILRILLQSQQLTDSQIENIIYIQVVQNVKFHMSRINHRKNSSMKLHQEVIQEISEGGKFQNYLEDLYLNLDLIKKIFYFKNSLQNFMNDKQNELAKNYSDSLEKFQSYYKFENISQIPQQYHYLFDNSGPQDENVIGLLEQVENYVGRLDKVQYSERFKNEKITKFRQVIEEVKYKY